ncbi:MAG: pilus assembly protein HicB [Mediterranea sp.]|jgi:predicted RNase H-like HicB family nuclease|nr:pilus assembly protein HicB [Mediterranea sp.]
MKKKAIVEMYEDGTYGIYVPEMACCALDGTGNSVQEAKDCMKEAYDEFVAYFKAQGEVPEELSNLELEYKYDVASFLDAFDWINVTKFAKRAGINDSLMRRYKNGSAFASEKQCNKIHQCAVNLAKELSAAML